MVFTKDLTQLLSVPEGMEHTAYLPNTTDTVPAGAFSHSARLTSVSVGESSAAYSSENGILYNKDKTTLVAVPAGYGDAVVIPESVTSIAPQAFAGSALKSIVVLGRVVGIDPTSFTDGTKAEATVVIPSSSTYESLKAVWERAGFSHFQEPAKPGDVTAPKDASVASGFTYELLEDYTLSVSWRGSFEPEPDLVVPSSAQFNGVTYRISTIAASAFENCESLKTARISSSISRIEDAAFRGCAQLTECTLSDGLTSIGASAFESTALTQVILPESVAAVEDCAFAHNGELASIVALSDIASVASSALEGCSGVSILTPYQEDDLYPWTPGISALGNHIEPYGIDLASEYMTLEVGQSGDLFDKASIDLPKDCSFSFSYPAACISVDSDGSVAAKKEGAADVSASIMFDGVVLADASRSVVISPQANSSSNKNASTGELSVSAFTSPLPLVGTVFSLNGSTIAPRGVAIDGGTSGGCTWDITDGKLTIKPTNGASGTLESFGDGTDITAVPWRSNAAAITSVDVGSGVKGGASLAYMFEGCSNLTKLDLSKLETTGVTKFDRMFMNCSKLASLDVSSLDTSNATNICYMFLGCSSLTSLDVSNFDTSKTSWFHGMFSGCTSLTSLDLSRFNTAKALRTYNMFLGCSSLTSLDLSNFNTANVTDMGGTFNGCSGLTDLNISSFTTAGVENMSFMFYGCSSLTSLDVSTFDTSNVVDMTSMFNRCRSVTALNLLNFSTANVTKAQGVFFECRSLDSLDLSKMSFSNATNIDRMFSGCTNLASLDLSSFNTSNAENMTSIFNGCSSLASLDLSSFNTAKVEFSNDMFTDTPQLSTIKIGAAYALDLPQRPAKNTAGATYTGKWVAKGGTAYDYNDYPKGIADTYTAPSGYILSFDTQEGSTPPESQIVPTGSKATAVGNPTKTGHTFTGWYTEAACTNKWDFTKSVMPAKDLTLYAGWKPNAYQITYETNGGSAVAAHNADYGSKLTQPTCTKLGYTPDGWFSDVGLTTKWDFAVNTVTGDTKLYAKWKANTYTIVFDANGGTGTMADQTGVVYGAATNLNANTYTKEGHTFAGWAMSATGSVQYTDGAQVTSLVASGETTLYAKWTPNDYNVIFNLDGGTGVTSPIKASYGSKLTKPSPDPTKQGYTFNNWYKNEAKTVLWNFATDTVGLTTTIYAKFTANTYSVRFDSNGGTGTVMQDQTFTYDTPAKALSQNTYTKQGYLFAGWSKTKGGAKDYADTEKVRNLALSGTLTLYAVWTPITYSVHFNSSEGEGSMDTQTGFTYDTPKALSPNRFSKKGHTFTGWATTASDPFVYKDQESVSTLATEQGQTVELYACWSKNTYLVTFESNNGSEVSPQDVLFGEVISKPTDPTRPGYTFVGWYRNKSLTLAWNFTTDTVQNETVLYAKWTAVIDIDVPLDPKISIDAQGTVITDEQALRPFISRSPQDVLVTSVSCSSTDTTQDIFPNASQWSNVKVTLTPNGSPADLVEVKINQSNFQPSLIIPAGTPITPAKLPISFGLILPQGIALAYSDQAEGVSVANLSYTFELLS